MEKEIIEIIKKYIYCDKHNGGDVIGFLILENIETEDYDKIKEYFKLTPAERKNEENENKVKTIDLL